MTLLGSKTAEDVATSSARAALLKDRNLGAFTLGSVKISAPAAGEVLVAVKASSLCHSDWNFIENDYGNPLPALLGHEFAGVVERVGPGVTQFQPGDHVVACVVPSCGACERCLEGERAWCLHPEIAQRATGDARIEADGKGVWQLSGLGGFADHTLIHESQLVAIDTRIPFDRAAVLGCAVVTGAGAVIRCAEVRPRQTVVVFGAGGVGLNALQAAALVGARKVIVVDVHEHKLELARKFGATHIVNANLVDPVETVLEITDGFGVDHAFEMTGLAGPLMQGYQMLGRKGTVYIVGMQKPGSTFDVPAADLGRGIGVRAVRMGSTNFKVDIPFYGELYLQGRLNLDDLVDRNITLDQINDAYASMLSGDSAGRSVITFD